MRKIFLTLIVYSLLLASGFRADAATSIDGVRFEIRNVEFGTWSKPRHHLVNDWVEQRGSDEPLAFIAIAYTVANDNVSKKLDFEKGLEMALVDNFGNRYRRMRKPDDFSKPVLVVSKNFPSVYPGESYGETVFFEAPITKATEVRLMINGEPLGIKDPIALAIGLPGERQRPSPTLTMADDQFSKKEPLGILEAINMPRQKNSLPEVIAAPQPPAVSVTNTPKIQESSIPPQTVLPQPDSVVPQAPLVGIQIVEPAKDAFFKPGDTVLLKVVTRGGWREQPPVLLQVHALMADFDDKAPSAENIYEIVVPENQSPGLATIRVFARWANRPAGQDTATDSLVIRIKSASAP